MARPDLIGVSMLTGGRDPHYAMGLLSGLLGEPLTIDFVTSPDMHGTRTDGRGTVRYLDLYQPTRGGALSKALAVLRNYVALCRYVLTTPNRIVHLLWYYKAEAFDNTVLTWLYRLAGKRLVLTVHNVNRGERDGNNGLINRVSLRVLYRGVDHIFVHTQESKRQLCRDFGVEDGKVTVIPFGVNIFTTQTAMDVAAARERLGVRSGEKVMLFFGNIAPYKGLDTLVDALALVPGVRLIIAGPVKKGCEDHWREIESAIEAKGVADRVKKDVKFIAEEDVEVYFKAAHVSVLPYKSISQSGVLFLSFGFGLPVIVSDADGLPESVDEGVNGLVFRQGDGADLARAIAAYFDSAMFADVDARRTAIVEQLYRRHSWDRVAEATCRTYHRLLASAPVADAAVAR